MVITLLDDCYLQVDLIYLLHLLDHHQIVVVTITTSLQRTQNLIQTWVTIIRVTLMPIDHGYDVVLLLYMDYSINYPNTLIKLLPKFDLADKGLADNHIDKFILVVQTMNVQHEDVVCLLFPLTFEGKAVVWYFSLTQESITSWSDFSQAFLNKFGEDKNPTVLVLELAMINMESK